MNARPPYPCEVIKYDNNAIIARSRHYSCDDAYRYCGFDQTMKTSERRKLRLKHFGPEGSGLIVVQRGNIRYEIRKL